MRRSKCELYFHFVWATSHRYAALQGEIERRVHRCIQSEAEKASCSVLALNGMPDHVHLIAQLPSSMSAARLMQRVKGVSSTFARQHLIFDEPFGWQDNYAAFTLSRSHLKRAIFYVQHQKKHHAAGTLWTEWEAVDE